MDKRQCEILIRRYFKLIFSDFTLLFLWLGQPLLLGWLIGLRWKGLYPNNTFAFVLSLTTLWLGTSSSCREIVKEKEIFLLERKLYLKVGPYLFSKYVVLIFFSFLQTIFLFYPLYKYVHLPYKILLFLLIFIGISSGVILGIFISALASSSDQAVGMVPVLLVPQILFSDIILPQVKILGWLKHLSLIFPLEWLYLLFLRFGKKQLNFKGLGEEIFLFLLSNLFYFILTYLIVKKKSDPLPLKYLEK